MDIRKEINKLGVIGSFSIYIPAALLLYTVTTYLIPYLSRTTGYESIIFWFITAGLGVFTPLIVTGIIILKAEGYNLSKKAFIQRLRFRRISKKDLIWAITALLIIGMLSGIIIFAMNSIFGEFNHTPSFLIFEPIKTDRYWLLLLWLPYWILNIIGEEFLWRGVMLPRQEIAIGNWTWLVHGVGWSLFHIAFGWELLITMLPIIFILSYTVQKTKNSWVGVIIHGGLNGPSFLAISFGLI